MDKSLLLSLIFTTVFSATGLSQILWYPFQKENSATTLLKTERSKTNLNESYAAFANHELEKAKYYLDQAQREGVKTGDFYFILGCYMFKTGEYRAARRYWKISHKEGGCWECKELVEKIDDSDFVNVAMMKRVAKYNEKNNGIP